MIPARDTDDASDQKERPAHHIRLPRFITDEDVGIRPCGRCERRAAALNRWITFTR